MQFMEYVDLHLLSYLPQTLKYMTMFYFFIKTLDFVTGLLKTWKGISPYKSSTMRDGLIRWISELVAISFVLGMDLILGLNFILMGATLALFIYKEAGSIVENLSVLGVTLPDEVKSALEKFNKKGGK